MDDLARTVELAALSIITALFVCTSILAVTVYKASENVDLDVIHKQYGYELEEGGK